MTKSNWYDLLRIEAQDLGLRWIERLKENSVFSFPVMQGQKKFGSLVARVTKVGNQEFAELRGATYGGSDRQHKLIEIVRYKTGKRAGNFCLRCPVCGNLRKKLFLHARLQISRNKKALSSMIVCQKCIGPGPER